MLVINLKKNTQLRLWKHVCNYNSDENTPPSSWIQNNDVGVLKYNEDQ